MRTDQELVERTLGGDLGAFEALVDRHRAVVRRVAGRIAGEDAADDVAQEAFLRAFHRLARFRAEASFRSWLLRITHNVALDALARQRGAPVDAWPEDGEAAELAPALPGERTPADRLEVAERRERLAGKLQLLTPPHRAVLVLRDLEGYSYEEIATATDAPLGSVKGRLFRARRELIELLRNNTYDWELPE
jgi:RNA polymerase sigma-70 factor (ECF subfamily)